MDDSHLKAREIEALAYVFEPSSPRRRRFGARTSMIALAIVVAAVALVAVRMLPG